MSTPDPTGAASATQQAQWIRKANLVLTKGSTGIDLSEMQFEFRIKAQDTETPNTCAIRVHNLSDATVKTIKGEFSEIRLQAGYETSSNYGEIFVGTIKQFRTGKDAANNVNSYLDIFASDADINYNFGFVNQTVAGGTTDEDVAKAIAQAMNIPLDPNAGGFLTGGIRPRGKTLIGLGRAYMRDIARTHNVRWSIQNGMLTLVPLTGYLPGEIVVLNSQTGLIGRPEQTDNGIDIRCLLNPKLQVGGRVQIDQASINQTSINPGGSGFPQYGAPIPLLASVTADGIYRVLAVEYQGDTRGGPWYSDITGLSVDPSVAPGVSVQAYG